MTVCNNITPCNMPVIRKMTITEDYRRLQRYYTDITEVSVASG